MLPILRLSRQVPCFRNLCSHRHFSNRAGEQQKASFTKRIGLLDDDGEDSASVYRVHGVPGHINGIDTFALASTESPHNVISEHFAVKCGLPIKLKGRAFKLANGVTTHTVGTTTAQWRFAGETTHKKVLTFHVLSTCSSDVVLGYEYLRESRTMDTNWHRIESQEVEEEHVPRINILGSATHSVVGTFEKEHIYGLPGTGCEANLVSEYYIRQRGLEWLVDRHVCRSLVLADGSLADTTGQISAAWRYGRDRWPWRTNFAVFDVMPDCQYHVVLGQDLLYGSAAYLRYTDCFVDKEPSAVRRLHGGVFLAPFFVRGLRSKAGLSAAVKVAGDSSIVRELERRVRADRHMAVMPEKERHLAEQAEQTRRSQWNNGHSASTGKSEASSGTGPCTPTMHDSDSIVSDSSLEELAKKKTLWAATVKDESSGEYHDDEYDPIIHIDH